MALFTRLRICRVPFVLIGSVLASLVFNSVSAEEEQNVSVADFRSGRIWQAGRLDYSDGSSEVAAFINASNKIQLQLVLCSLNSPASYRMILLLPHRPKYSGPVPATLSADGIPVEAYGEVIGNALEFQVGISFFVSLPDSSGIDINFSESDAASLGIPHRLHFSAGEISAVLSAVARSCVLLCKDSSFSCNRSLLSGLLWPRRGFTNTPAAGGALILPIVSDNRDDEELPKVIIGDGEEYSVKPDKQEAVTHDSPVVKGIASEGYAALGTEALDKACLRWPRSISGYERSVSDMYNLTPSFTLTEKCRRLLDQRYAQDGVWPLHFLPSLFFSKNGDYQRYAEKWNSLVSAVDPEGKNIEVRVSDEDYYLMLYSLFTDTVIHEYPQSYFDMLNYREEPESFLYAMDNRYDLETVKYYAVLDRRINHSISLVRTAAACYGIWNDFYQEFSESLPPIPKAGALRPVIYRQMLMRLWRLAGYPEPLHLKPEYAFSRGSGHKTLTGDKLEAECSVFEGLGGDQFFFASEACIKGIDRELTKGSFKSLLLQDVLSSWQQFEEEAQKSGLFIKEDMKTGLSQLRSSLYLPLLTMFNIYGFGDYFLQRSCISTRDKDICSFILRRSIQDYKNECRNVLSELSADGENSAAELSSILKLWDIYFEKLKAYAEEQIALGNTEPWRARMMLGIAVNLHAELLLTLGHGGEVSED